MLSAELKAFYMVARLGSITLAAKKLGLSQPTELPQGALGRAVAGSVLGVAQEMAPA